MKSSETGGGELLFLSFNQEASYVLRLAHCCHLSMTLPRSVIARRCRYRATLLTTSRVFPSKLTICRCISVGTRRGFSIYNCEPFGKVFQEEIGGVGVAEMLYCTSLVALVGAGEQVNGRL